MGDAQLPEHSAISISTAFIRPIIIPANTSMNNSSRNGMAPIKTLMSLPRAALRDGDNIAWNNLLNYVRYNDLSNNANYSQAGTLVDIENFIDYLIIQIIRRQF